MDYIAERLNEVRNPPKLECKLADSRLRSLAMVS